MVILFTHPFMPLHFNHIYVIRSKIYLHRLNPDKQRAQELDGQHSDDGCMIYCWHLFI